MGLPLLPATATHVQVGLDDRQQIGIDGWDWMRPEVCSECLSADIIEGEDAGVILESGTLGEVRVEVVAHGLGQFVLHVVHVDLRVPDLDGLSDRVQPS